MKVNFLIGGMQKCGTTALHAFLSEHPKVIGSDPKELDYFNYPRPLQAGEVAYHANFAKPRFAKLRGFQFFEGSPSYMNDGDVAQTAQRIHAYNPQMKVICMVRNPVDRAFSAWNMYRKRVQDGNPDWWFDWMEARTGKPSKAARREAIEYEDFARFVERELDCLSAGTELESRALQIGHYHRGIAIYKRVFGENLLVVPNEELQADTPATLARIADFLGLAPFNWSAFANQKVFAGTYHTEIAPGVRRDLNEHYKDANLELFALTQIEY